MKYKLKFRILFVLTVIISLATIFHNASFATNSSATIDTSPSSGKFVENKPVKVEIIVNGRGQKFNAAKATVTLSQNIHVLSLTPGNCNFSYLKKPSTSDASFTGAILGKSSMSCIVYSLSITSKQGPAKIMISNASIRSYPDSIEILKSVRNASFTFTPKGIKKTTQDGKDQIKITPLPTTLPKSHNPFITFFHSFFGK